MASPDQKVNPRSSKREILWEQIGWIRKIKNNRDLNAIESARILKVKDRKVFQIIVRGLIETFTQHSSNLAHCNLFWSINCNLNLSSSLVRITVMQILQWIAFSVFSNHRIRKVEWIIDFWVHVMDGALCELFRAILMSHFDIFVVEIYHNFRCTFLSTYCPPPPPWPPGAATATATHANKAICKNRNFNPRTLFDHNFTRNSYTNFSCHFT